MSNLGKKYRTKRVRRNELKIILGFGTLIFMVVIFALLGIAGI